jgi:hypothetical protein
MHGLVQNRRLGELVQIVSTRVGLHHVDGVAVVVAEVGELIKNRRFTLAIAFNNVEVKVEQRSIVLQRRFIRAREEVIARVVKGEKILSSSRQCSDAG